MEHTRVGTPCGDHRDVVARNFAYRALQRILHATTGRLRLEAAERETGIFDGECEAHDGG